MKTSKEIKDAVKQKYGQIARGEVSSVEPTGSCCGTDDQTVVNLALRYEEADQAAIPEGADLGLGCGTPAAYADMKEGMTVLDLGSGAGIDCFVASRHVGKSGHVIGIDMTEEMIKKANENKAKVD
ncbi:MAG TPA: methyltransferase domain-containing protein, partial [Bacteroidota bacterium]|nr:methyltransferase domain-containing protein [Bacteroidota bacterium]